MIRSNGWPYNRKRATNYPDEVIEAVGTAYRAGVTVSQIARDHGITRPTVIRWAKMYGWQRVDTNREAEKKTE
jgi:transposase-like protein